MRTRVIWTTAAFLAMLSLLTWTAFGHNPSVKAAESEAGAIVTGTEVSASSPSSPEQPSSQQDVTPPPELATVNPAAVAASGPVPTGIEMAAAASDPLYQIAKKIWESGAQVIPTGDGQYVIPLPERIPADFKYPTETIAAHAPLRATEAAAIRPPHFLAHDEFALYAKLMSQGACFQVAQGPDGYLHVSQ